MRRIYKSSEPAALLAWKVGKNWQGNPPKWTDFDAETSKAVKAQASQDQSQLCCYCTGGIGNGASHIEHFRPQSVYPKRRYAWSNLLVSCESTWIVENPAKRQRHCGHEKDNWFDNTLTIDPQTNVGPLFRYRLDGHIFPAKDLPAQRYTAVSTTIEKLNLNAPALQDRRAAVLADAAKDAEKLEHDAWRALYLEPQAGASLAEFWPALSYNYEKFWRDSFVVAPPL
jgi:uncharacterized protein (TIGR02646 family)